LTGIYVFGRQNIYARVVTKEFNYQRFTQLDHNEYEIVTRWLYKFGSDLEGVVGVTRTRGMVPFLDLGGSQLTLSVVTQQKENVNFDYKLSPRWTLQGTTGIGTSREPVVNSPDLELKETLTPRLSSTWASASSAAASPPAMGPADTAARPPPITRPSVNLRPDSWRAS